MRSLMQPPVALNDQTISIPQGQAVVKFQGITSKLLVINVLDGWQGIL